YTDSYVNLSIKSLSYLRWVKHSCRKTQFVLKTDDDVYINLPLLMKTLESITETQFIMGNLFKRARPIRTNGTKWFTSYAQYKGNIFPDYVSGSAYLLSVDLVPKLYAESFKRKIFWLEDIYITGILADAVKAIRINNDKFSYFKRPGYGCSFKNLISGHRVTP
ncbi:beta-1,3-galactosyltransferase 5-like, partial [Argonauta hians]